MQVPDSALDLFEKQTFAHVSTILPDGSPHVTPVWIDYDPEAGHLLFNTARGRRKERNLRANPDVALSMTDPDDPYRFLAVQGEAVELTEDGAVDHINELAQRYMDVEEYPNLGDEEGARVIVRIEPETVTTS
ncbi:PPOX class F420-dependent oxidoreductase [Halorientalis salina]|uniref:PPOX class F420-dependent oxidoreductase n=1 Tax=Halorientalis salina TaxID=2932266 RepID=UPI0010AD347C|nr:PPOX class F420-dependent oxidoreductase [Halorientalis salina]